MAGMSVSLASTQSWPMTLTGSLPTLRSVSSTREHSGGTASSPTLNCMRSLLSIVSLHGSACATDAPSSRATTTIPCIPLISSPPLRVSKRQPGEEEQRVVPTRRPAEAVVIDRPAVEAGVDGVLKSDPHVDPGAHPGIDLAEGNVLELQRCTARVG